MTPTKRTLAEARRLGFRAEVVERYNSFTKQRKDLFGFCDIVAVRPGVGCLLIQTTSDTNHSARVAKIRDMPDVLRDCYGAGLRVEVWSWGKRGERGKRKVWTLRREEVTPSGE